MKPTTIVAAAALAATLFSFGPADACSTFCLRDGDRVIFGKNYDWGVSDGMLMVNKRGVAKQGLLDGVGGKGQWSSRYGSVTFNQYGREFPMGGMNEAGLVIEVMWLEATRYPEPDRRAPFNCLHWVQYQLDTAATVDDVLASDATVRVESQSPIHYLVADRSGRVATIEFLNGKIVAHTGDGLPMAALTNSTYERSFRYAVSLQEKGRSIPPGNGSLDRFARAADRVEAFNAKSGTDPVDYAFDTLSSVAQGRYTQWSIVYEIDRGVIHFRTRRNLAIKTIDVSVLDFTCAKPTLVMDMHQGKGDVEELLRVYSLELNERLVRSSFGQTSFLADTPDSLLMQYAGYPGSTTCNGAATLNP